MIRKIIRRIKELVNRSVARVKVRTQRHGWLAHHGMQRNGTNFLLLALKQMDIDVINEFDPQRNQPQHKHFRWYRNKDRIPDYIKHDYHNTLTVNSVDELNGLCGYPADTRHIVIQKRREDAVVSVANWGLRCQWFASKQDALENMPVIARDYDAYYDFWSGLAAAEPARVALVRFEALIEDTQSLTSALGRLGYSVGPEHQRLQFDEVPQSPKNRAKQITAADYEAVFAAEVP
ncbi:MAG: hypothetical protein SV765_12520 [Pseudomonadota bacterium]|nr:hypothetical protein [Pseudomonadota bacterium]